MLKNLSTSPLPISEWDSSLSHIIDDMKGQPINVHCLMANHPELLNAWWNFRNYSISGGKLGKRKGELVILRVAVHMKTWYEWASHVQRSLACGLSLDEIENVKSKSLDTWEVSEALLLMVVDELIENQKISHENYVRLSEYFTIEEIMDIIAIHGMYIILACMINTWSLNLDESVKKILPDGVTQEKFVAEVSGW